MGSGMSQPQSSVCNGSWLQLRVSASWREPQHGPGTAGAADSEIAPGAAQWVLGIGHSVETGVSLQSWMG